MACISPYFSPKPYTLNLSSHKPLIKPSQLNYSHYSSLIKSLNLTQPTNLRTSVIRACSRSESDKLPSDVRKQAINAINSSERRLMIGDVVSKTGLNFNEAQKALQALAADTNGFLEVSDEGDIVYVFPKNYQLKLAAKSFGIKIGSLFEMVKIVPITLVRVSFGISLMASMSTWLNGIILLAVIIVHEEAVVSEIIRFAFDTLFGCGDLCKSIFSVVFGDGDPNQGIEEKKWKMISQYIARNGGVVTAEELTPYLDPKATGNMDNDHSYMLPVLVRFHGHPEADEEGNILYRFPLVQRIAAPQSEGEKCEIYLKEKKWIFSDAHDIQTVTCLLGYNIVSTLFQLPVDDWFSITAIRRGFISVPTSIFQLFLRMYMIYVVSFLVIAIARRVLIREPNVGIDERNEARVKHANALKSPNISLKKKILSARNMAQRTSIAKDKIVYSTERDLNDYEKQELDRRFKGKGDLVPDC